METFLGFTIGMFAFIFTCIVITEHKTIKETGYLLHLCVPTIIMWILAICAYNGVRL